MYYGHKILFVRGTKPHSLISNVSYNYKEIFKFGNILPVIIIVGYEKK